ncbi:HAMP domain-containing sensor histidine kinase [uncultured Kriegella sp.]|uniref:sensor histidine kinase n=1 Tax=uncultured Kriegella sp. TaxID=1798910 RepID=UPI0030D79858|tara:strand:- start:184665 stop:185921 length:1257 start_codon:yes stop_codon:yes gene_type:complete
MVERTKKIRLLRKTSKAFLWVSFVLMLVSTIILYFYVRNLLQDEVEEELRSTEARIVSAIGENKPTYQLPPVVEIEHVSLLETERLKDTLIFDPSQSELEEFRELTTYSEIDGKKYRITVRTLIVESEDILVAVVVSYLVIILLVFSFLFYFNKAWNQKLWHPFFENLEQMKRFSLTSDKPIVLMDSNILEFSELNYEITALTDKVRSDFKNLKQYTEDVSHEMQTPLAIIQAKVENIINDDNLNDVQFEHLTSIQKDIQRLAQMNKRLTLLTKIENQQFSNVEKVDITHYITETIKNFSEISNKEIKFERNDAIWADMDRYLAEVLCNNLISNAIKYTTKNIDVKVTASDKTLSVSNCGNKALQHPENLYTRFYRESETIKSTGLGLAIVKHICDLYGFQVDYKFENDMHTFLITFK